MAKIKTPKTGEESPLKIIKPRTQTQNEYFNAITNNTITLCTGPSGTGKTLIPSFIAAKALYDNTIEKVIITRPIVEAGESLGYLPGDVAEKVDPYVRPVLDCFEKVIPKSMLRSWISEGKIEMCPFAYMRGRNFDNAFIIADECQNAIYSQLKLLLTRIGEGTKMIITADMDQIDLCDGDISGMIDIPRKISHIEGVAFVKFAPVDVQRSKIVSELVKYL